MKQPKNHSLSNILLLIIISLLIGLVIDFKPVANQKEKELVAAILPNLKLSNVAFRWDVKMVVDDFEEVSKFRPSIEYGNFMDSAMVFYTEQQKRIANFPIHNLDSLTAFFQLMDSMHYRWLMSLAENNPFMKNEINSIPSYLSSNYMDSLLVIATHDSEFRKQLLNNKLWRNNLAFHNYLSAKVTSCGGYNFDYFMPVLSSNTVYLGDTLKANILISQEQKSRYAYTMNGQSVESFLNEPTTINVKPTTTGKQEIPITVKIVPLYFRGFKEVADTITIQENITYYAQ